MYVVKKHQLEQLSFFNLTLTPSKDQKPAELGVRGLPVNSGVPYFFCLAREFWNHTCVTLLLRPVSCAIRSRSCPSGLESMLKFAWRIWSCSSVNVVRTRLVLWHLIIPPLEGESSLSASKRKETQGHVSVITKGKQSSVQVTHECSLSRVSKWNEPSKPYQWPVPRFSYSKYTGDDNKANDQQSNSPKHYHYRERLGEHAIRYNVWLAFASEGQKKINRNNGVTLLNFTLS